MTQREERPRRSRPVLDARLLVGLVLVVASIAGVLALLDAADRSVAVYTARRALEPGERVGADDLDVVRVGLASAADAYATTGRIPAEGAIVTRPVARGELVPVRALGSAAGARLASVVVTPRGPLSADVVEGATVDVWSAPALDGGAFGPPAVLVPSATVVAVTEAGGLVVDDETASVELLVPRDRVARVLEAVADGDAVSLVPTSLPLAR